ncbi:D-aspartate oxidase [Anoplophora glabripennis]|uniref:D-aspartate oxidase n=1 Tax=Anoplophora glabripennis TaxID=217634 RepID=UPI0008735524|nr:D-aspartate oxidase [Anoplophora glabripennis]
MYEIAVIGCGVIGLTSALSIQERLKNVKVTIFTRDKSPNTTGDIAAGYWEPYMVGDTPPAQITRWGKATYDYILKLWKEGKAKEAGISLIISRIISDRKDVENPFWKDVVLGYSNLSREYLDKFGKVGNRKFISGFEFLSFTWEASIFLPFLEQKFLMNGGVIVRKEIRDFKELEDFDVIVNCTGLDAKDLTGDTKLCPLRGQIARVSASWMFYLFLIDSEHDRSCYVIPNIHCVILGGTSQPAYNLEVDEVDKKNIFRNCSELVPALATAEVIKHQVGLRPGRERVRLEIEIKPGGKNGLLRIVHNYGHGGAGITLSIGCAEDCAKLVERALNQTNLRNKL